MEGRKIQRASQEQNNYLLEFIQHNPELVNNKTLMCGETFHDRQKKWIQLCEQLNAIGPKKTDYKGWQALWKEWRRRVKRRANEVVTAQQGTKPLRDLNDEETAVINLIGWDAASHTSKNGLQAFNFESTMNTPSVKSEVAVDAPKFQLTNSEMHEFDVLQEKVITVELIPHETQQEEIHHQIDEHAQTERIQPKSKQRRRVPKSVSAQLIAIVQQAFMDNKELQERQIRALETHNELVLRQTIALEKLAMHFQQPHKNT